MEQTRTKIICTIGPAVESYEKIVELIEAGMNVARLNFSHGTYETHAKVIERLKKARKELKRPLAIMLDTKGPELRVGKVPEDSIELHPGDLLTLAKEENLGQKIIALKPASVIEELSKGMTILFDDGYISSHVVEVEQDRVVVEIENAGILHSGKGVNIPHAKLNLPAMTKKDIEDIQFGAEQDVDVIAASFIRSAEHVLSIKRLLAEEGKPDILVIAKIESAEGVENFDSIVQVSDGIMIARGDLGVEVDLGQVPKLQKMMIRKCYQACKPVVTATQMLESMMIYLRPTRAEVSDVANAIYDGTSAVMLSGETAVGKYPIEVVKQMKSIVDQTEQDFSFREFFYQNFHKEYHDVSSAVALAAVKTAYSADAKAIFAFTTSGFTVRLVSRFRPKMPIIALTNSEKVYHQLAFNWGVIPILETAKNSSEAFEKTAKAALEKKIVDFGDLVIVTAGIPFGKVGSTNLMKVESIGNILVRGEKGKGPSIEGIVSLLLSPEGIDINSVKGKLLVIDRCDANYMPLIKESSGIILQNSPEDKEGESYALILAKTFNLPILVRSASAMSILQEGQKVILDPQKGIVYSP